LLTNGRKSFALGWIDVEAGISSRFIYLVGWTGLPEKGGCKEEEIWGKYFVDDISPQEVSIFHPPFTSRPFGTLDSKNLPRLDSPCAALLLVRTFFGVADYHGT
jgi:hypothetical protein